MGRSCAEDSTYGQCTKSHDPMSTLHGKYQGTHIKMTKGNWYITMGIIKMTR
jgi:hypothetical protein